MDKPRIDDVGIEYVMVLEDGETYTQLSGCKILVLNKRLWDDNPEAQDEMVAELYQQGSMYYGDVVADFGANGMVIGRALGLNVSFP